MVDITFFEKISLIFNFLKENITFTLILLLTLVIIMDLLYGRNKKSTKRLYILIIFFLIVYTLFTYHNPLINILDVYIANVFRMTYFPSIIEYVTMLFVTIIIQIISYKKSNKVIKHINIWIGIIIEILFIINLIAMNNVTIDLNTLTSIYENDILLSIFQLSGFVFMIWLIINIIMFIISLFLSKKIEMPRLNNDYD